MRASSIQKFMQAALVDPIACWQAHGLQQIGDLQVPDDMYGNRSWMFRGDIHRLWAEWFLGACVDIVRLKEKNATYPYLYSEIYDYFVAEFGPTESAITLAREIASLANYKLDQMRNSDPRKVLNERERQALVDLEDGKPRCWVCGYAFSDEAISNFIHRSSHKIPLRRLVDVMTLKGLIEKDLRIEVDHVFPFSKGGSHDGANLKLACGWCNRYKSDYTSIYEVPGHARKIKTLAGKYFSVPQPFWVVRILALASNVEQPFAKDCEFTVTWKNINAKATPPNLKIVPYSELPVEQLQRRSNISQKN